jgi:hypothetical protein
VEAATTAEEEEDDRRDQLDEEELWAETDTNKARTASTRNTVRDMTRERGVGGGEEGELGSGERERREWRRVARRCEVGKEVV